MRDRPNILLLMCDDLGYGDTGFNGHPVIRTPHLDALAAEGGRFTRFYAGGPVCSPTRGTCLTGRHYSRYGITHANVGHLPAEEVTLARLLKAAGYTTGHFGKWHLGTLERDYSGKPGRRPEVHYAPPWERDYDVSFATEYAVPTWDPGRGYDMRTYARSDEPWASPYYLNGERVGETLLGCDSRHIVDHALPFIAGAVAAGQPFFSTVWFHAPHTPVEAGPEYLAMYAGCESEEAHYYGVVTAVDDQVGRLMAQLRQLGVAGDTIVWFCSDNGPEGSTDLSRNGRSRGTTAGLRGRKRSLFNGGVGVPAVVRWPGLVAPGTLFEQPCSTLDYLPTIRDLLGLPMPDDRPLDGISLLPMLRGETSERGVPIPYRFLDSEAAMFGSPTLALTDDRFKFLTNLSADGAEDLLFDLIADPFETTSVLADHPERAARMRAHLAGFIDSCRRSHHGADYATPVTPADPFQEITGGWS